MIALGATITEINTARQHVAAQSVIMLAGVKVLPIQKGEVNAAVNDHLDDLIAVPGQDVTAVVTCNLSIEAQGRARELS